METAKYICEFFFGNFWHWLGGLFYLCIICGVAIPGIIWRLGDKDDDKDEDK